MIHELIILQEELEKLAKLPRVTEDEFQGTCLYHRAIDSFLYDSIGGSVITGRGSPGTVTSDKNVLRKVNGFLEQNPNYGYVEFHTHSIGTIRRFGDRYNFEFSPGDIDMIKESASDYPDYRHMLITPKKIKLVRYDRTTNSIVDLPIPRQVNLDMLYQLRSYISKSLELL